MVSRSAAEYHVPVVSADERCLTVFALATSHRGIGRGHHVSGVRGARGLLIDCCIGSLMMTLNAVRVALFRIIYTPYRILTQCMVSDTSESLTRQSPILPG